MTPTDAPRTIRIALAQINVTVGDLEGNADRIIAWNRTNRYLQDGLRRDG